MVSCKENTSIGGLKIFNKLFCKFLNLGMNVAIYICTIPK